jgi:enediyne biosynthesis protein E5
MKSFKNWLRAGGDRRLAALRRFALSITVFNLAGHTLLGFEQAWVHPLVALLTAYTCELALEGIEAFAQRRTTRYGGLHGIVDFLLPAHITGLATSMLLYTGQRAMLIMFATAVGVASKYLFRAPVNGRWRHVMNPSNTGIAVTLVLFPSVGIAPPYHFTENLSGLLDWIVPFAVFASGIFLNWKLTGKLPMILAWLGGFALQAVIRTALLDATLMAALLPMTGLAFLLFTTYMITDPGTTPFATQGQIAFGLTVAAVYGLLMTLHVVFGLFFALVITSALRGVGLYALQLRRAYAERQVKPEFARPVEAPAEVIAS